MSKLFAIGLEVEEVAVGRVLRVLDALSGVAKINLNLNGQKRGEIQGEEGEPVPRMLAAPTTKKTYKPRNMSDPRGRSDQAIADALKDGELHIKRLSDFIVRRGFKAVSVASLLNRMYVLDYIKRVSPGVWTLTSSGRKKFFPGNSATPVADKRARSGGNYGNIRAPDNSRGIRRAVLELLKSGPRSTSEVTKAIVEKGYSSKNMSGTVYKMRVDPPGLVMLRNGVYSLTPRGASEIEEISQHSPSEPLHHPQEEAAE